MNNDDLNLHSMTKLSGWLRYCLLYGVPAYQLDKLRRVQNVAARLVIMENTFCHITPLLLKLHWLPVEFRENFKIRLITFKAIHGLAPSYITELITIKSFTMGRYALRSSNELLLKPLLCKTCTTHGERHLWHLKSHYFRLAFDF